MPSIEFIAAAALAVAFGALFLSIIEVIRDTRRAKSSTRGVAVTIANQEGERIVVNLDPNNDASVDRFFEAVDTIKQGDRGASLGSHPGKRQPILTLG